MVPTHLHHPHPFPSRLEAIDHTSNPFKLIPKHRSTPQVLIGASSRKLAFLIHHQFHLENRLPSISSSGKSYLTYGASGFDLGFGLVQTVIDCGLQEPEEAGGGVVDSDGGGGGFAGGGD
ncbi:unnamed protein product [Lactuca saligna]|uniref:Uncharacterized protein n=1 Tax=Lactuca saligna TaxID=75948 RepID=A0AA35YVC8_LACSI|nr:unnamed protein product [Lactuca saligna]